MPPARATGRTCFTSCGCYRRRKGEPKGFTWADYRDLSIAAHRQLAAPLVWVWDNLNVHQAPALAEYVEQNQAWLRIYRRPAFAPELNPAEGNQDAAQAVHDQLRPPPT